MADEIQNCDAVVVGAGFSGMYTLKALRDKLGLKVRVYEAGETVGGTWYWNRYPGARCDSDSYVYCFTWDEQLLKEWEWSERYPEQPEILRYLEHVAERHDLKQDIRFNTRVIGAEFDEINKHWKVHTDRGEEVTARYLIAAVGSLSDTNLPPFKGLEKFQGKTYHQSIPPYRRRLHSQARGCGRNGRQRCAGHSGNLAAGKAAHGVSAHRQLLCARAQWQGRCRTGQGAKGGL